MHVTIGRLLVLDDDQQVSFTIREMAQAAGFVASACNTADDFFAQIASFDPTHIVLDLAMPGLDGVEVLRQLAQQNCFATIIIVSGLGEKVLNAAKTAAVESGLRVAGVLPKPFRISALRHLLNTYSNTSHGYQNKPALSNELTVERLQQLLQQHGLEVHH